MKTVEEIIDFDKYTNINLKIIGIIPVSIHNLSLFGFTIISHQRKIYFKQYYDKKEIIEVINYFIKRYPYFMEFLNKPYENLSLKSTEYSNGAAHSFYHTKNNPNKSPIYTQKKEVYASPMFNTEDLNLPLSYIVGSDPYFDSLRKYADGQNILPFICLTVS